MTDLGPPRSPLSVRRACAVLACAALCCGTLGCRSGAEDEQRRELLKPVDTKRLAEERRRARQLFDDKGELLESGEVVAGVVLPKGLELTWHKDHRWVYETRKIAHSKVADYFSRRLMSTTVDRRDDMVVFGGALPVKNLKSPRMRVEVQALRGHATATRVVIEQYVPRKAIVPPDVAEAQLRAARERAD